MENDAVSLENLRGRVGRLETDMATISHDHKQFKSFVDRFEAVEVEREKQQEQRHQQNSELLEEINNKVAKRSLWAAIAGLALSLAGIGLACLSIVAMFWLARH